jgi:hypothetical protein
VYRILLGLGLVVSTAACVVGALAFHALSLVDPERAGGVVTIALSAAGPALAIAGAMRSERDLTSTGIGLVMASLAIALVGALLALLIFLTTPTG